MAKKSELERQLEELEKLKTRGIVTDEEYETRRAAILSSTGTATPKGGGGGKGILKFGAFGCIGAFAAIGVVVIGLIVIIAAALSSAADDEDDMGGDVRVPLAVGSSGTIAPEGNGSKKQKVTILQIADDVQPDNPFSRPTEGKKYWALEVEVENVGTKEVSSLDWKIRDSNDVETDRTIVAGIDPDLELFYNLTPGGKTRGWVVFEISADAQPKWVRADPNPFLAHDLYFDAE